MALFNSARVMPIYIMNSKLEASNYRQVSMLNTISKLFKMIVYEQLDEYIQTHELFLYTNLVLYPHILPTRPLYISRFPKTGKANEFMQLTRCITFFLNNQGMSL